MANMPTQAAVGMPPEKGPFDARNNTRAPAAMPSENMAALRLAMAPNPNVEG